MISQFKSYKRFVRKSGKDDEEDVVSAALVTV